MSRFILAAQAQRDRDRLRDLDRIDGWDDGVSNMSGETAISGRPQPAPLSSRVTSSAPPSYPGAPLTDADDLYPPPPRSRYPPPPGTVQAEADPQHVPLVAEVPARAGSTGEESLSPFRTEARVPMPAYPTDEYLDDRFVPGNARGLGPDPGMAAMLAEEEEDDGDVRIMLALDYGTTYTGESCRLLESFRC